MRRGRTLPLRGLLYELSRCTNSPFANARRYVDICSVVSWFGALLLSTLTGGVVSNEVACQLPSLTPSKSASVKVSATATLERAGMLERLTVPLRDTSVTEKVALRRGSSQQGRARRASVGCDKRM